MSSSLYEIVELANGDVALRRVDGEEGDAALVSIQFSEESLFFLGSSKLEVAKTMIEAGLEVVSGIIESDELDDNQVDGIEELERGDDTTIH